MADLPETLTITVTIPPGSVTAGATIQAISTIGMGVPGQAGPAPAIVNGTIATGAPGSPAVLTLTLIAPGTYRLDGSIPEGDPGAGAGDFVGPSGATDGHVVLFDGPTGKLGKSGGALGTASAANTGTSSGNVPILDGGGKLATSTLPALAITSVNVVASQAAMLALAAEQGDIAVRSDLNKTFALSTNSPSTLADWKELLTPTDAVLSVAGKTGAVTLVKGDVGLGSVDNTSDAGKPVSTSQATAIGLKLDISAKAVASDLQVGTDNTKYATASAIRAAMAFTALTDAATIAVDMATGFNFSVTLGGNRTLGAPTNSIAGQSGLILVTQDGTGSRTLSYNAAWKFAGGTPTASTAAGTVDAIAYTVTTGGGSPIIRATYIKAFA